MLLRDSIRVFAKNQVLVLLHGHWIEQPIKLALENQKRGCQIFSHADFLKWKKAKYERERPKPKKERPEFPISQRAELFRFINNIEIKPDK